MRFVESVRFPSMRQVEQPFRAGSGGPFLNLYPQNLFHEFNVLEPWPFGSVNLLYGGNGAGKSTMLRILSYLLGCQIKAEGDEAVAARFKRLAEHTKLIWGSDRPASCRLIRSEDIALALHRVRQDNRSAAVQRRELVSRYYSAVRKWEHHLPLSDEEQSLFDHYCDRRGHHTGGLARDLAPSREEFSNGETSMQYLCNLFEPFGLYLLDEPENSLSPLFQRELAKTIEDYARCQHCQFFIASHSPFLLTIPDACIFRLDGEAPGLVASYAHLPGMRAYFDLMESIRGSFLKSDE